MSRRVPRKKVAEPLPVSVPGKRKADSPPTRAPTAPRIAPNGYRLPDPLPVGEVLTDNTKSQWIIGTSIGCGGFGEIYTARPYSGSTPVKASSRSSDDCEFVAKVDHYSGPLYAETHFYHRVSKEESISKWMKEKNLNFLGMPRFIASGIHEKHTTVEVKKRGKKAAPASGGDICKYRFLVMQRFGDDLQKKLQEHNNIFDLKTAYTLAIKIIDILEYIHSFGYIHADVKASNLLLGPSRLSKGGRRGSYSESSSDVHNEVWLVDYGLVERYITREGVHRLLEEDNRRANNGTVEFTSRDAHIGALSRRSDLEVLAFNILSWLSGGRLPWMSNLRDHRFVLETKKYYMERLHELLNFAFKKTGDNCDPATTTKGSSATANGSAPSKSKKALVDAPPGLLELFNYIVKLGFQEEPDYVFMKSILSRAIIKSGSVNDGKLNLSRRKGLRCINTDTEETNNHAENRVASASPSPPKRSRKDGPVKEARDKIPAKSPKIRSFSVPAPKEKPVSRQTRGQVSNSSRGTSGSRSTETEPEEQAFGNMTAAMADVLQKMKEKKQVQQKQKQKKVVKKRSS